MVQLKKEKKKKEVKIIQWQMKMVCKYKTVERSNYLIQCKLLAIGCICFVRRRRERERESKRKLTSKHEVLVLILLQRLGARTQSLDQAVTAIGSNEPETEEGKNRTLVTTNAKNASERERKSENPASLDSFAA